MRVQWSENEPPVPLDRGCDPEDEPSLEIYNTDGKLCAVRKTQLLAYPDRHGVSQVHIWVDGVLPSSATTLDSTEIMNHAIHVKSYDEDPVKQKPTRITNFEDRGQIVALTVSL